MTPTRSFGSTRQNPVALATVLLLSLVNCGSCERQPRNVLLILVDTLRADHVSALGYARETTPNIERLLAARGVRFERCISQAPWTKPSAASILTSLYPTAHTANLQNSRLPDAVVTLAEILRERGLTTQAFVSGHFMRARHGLAQGFDDYNEDHVYGRNRVTSIDLTDAALSWLDGRDSDRFFLMLHYYEPHYNYAHHPEYAFADAEHGRIHSNIPIETIREEGSTFTPEELTTLVGYYDSEIRLVDESVARVLARLEALGLADGTLVLFTADHGEHFGEHGLWGHEESIYKQLISVPLIVAGPGVPRGRTVRELTGTIDIAPTILDLLETPAPAAFQGASLMPVANGASRDRPAVEISETFKEIRQKAVVSEHRMLVQNEANRGRPPFELFDLDRGDGTTIVAEPETERRLLAHLIAHEARFVSNEIRAESWTLDPDELELLRSLGYVGGSAPGESRAARVHVVPAAADGELRVPVGSVRLVLDDFWDTEEHEGRMFVWTRARSTLSVYALEPSSKYRAILEIVDTAGNSHVSVGATAESIEPLPVAPDRTVTLSQPVTTDSRGVLELVLESTTWRPSDRQAGSTDNRELGWCLGGLRLRALPTR